MKHATSGPGSRLGPLIVGAVAMCLATVFVVARADAVGIDGFIGAGTTYGSDPGIRLTPGHGYDGQFYYRLALSPLSTERQVGGIEFDGAPYRQQRIGYPAIAWVVAIVLPISTETALVAVNVAAIGLMTFLGARVAVHFGRSPSWGLVLLAWPAFLFSLAFNLAEVLAAAAVLMAVLAVLHQRHEVATATLVGGVLIRETLVVIAVILIWTTRRWLYAVPAAVLVIWQGIIWMMWGGLPILDSAAHPDGSRVGLPFVGFIQGTEHWSLIDLAILTALVAALWANRKAIGNARFVRLGLTAYGVLALVLARPVWESWRGWGRALTEFVVLLFVVRVSTGRHPLIADDGRNSARPTAPPPPASAPALAPRSRP